MPDDVADFCPNAFRPVEVTEAMLEAGLKALAENWLGVAEAVPEAERLAVIGIFTEMWEARQIGAP